MPFATLNAFFAERTCLPDGTMFLSFMGSPPYLKRSLTVALLLLGLALDLIALAASLRALVAAQCAAGFLETSLRLVQRAIALVSCAAPGHLTSPWFRYPASKKIGTPSGTGKTPKGTFRSPSNRNASMEGTRSEGGSEPMQKSTARDDRSRAAERAHRHDALPTWRKTTPRANPEVHREDLARGTERLEMLLGH